MTPPGEFDNVARVVELSDIEAARQALAGVIYTSPCAFSETLSQLTMSRCFVKLENLQMTGSFKERGAANLLRSLKKVALGGRTVALVLSGGNIDVNVISRIIERGLVKDGRLVRLTVLLQDRPGALSRLTALVAEARANILHIVHDRAFSRARIGETEVELTLETSGRAQIEAVIRHLRNAGYQVKELSAGERR